MKKLHIGVAFSLFAFSLCGPYPLVNASVGLLILFVLSQWRSFTWTPDSTAMVTLGLFAVLAIGCLFSNDAHRGWKVLERNLSLCIFSLLAFTGIFRKKGKSIPFKALIVSAVIFALVCLGFAAHKSFITGSFYDPVHETHFSYNNFIHQNLTHWIGLNAVYLSAIAGLSLLFILHLCLTRFRHLSKQRIALYLIITGFLVVVIILCKSAMATLALTVAMIFMLAFDPGIKPLIKRFRFLAAGLITAMATLAVWVAATKLEITTLQIDYSDPHLRPFLIRLAIWESAFEMIQKAPWLGYGTGDSLEAILSSYTNKGFVIGLDNQFNAHNEFLELWLQCGIVGPLALLTALFVRFRAAIKHLDFVLCGALIMFAMLSLSESTLLTFRGIAFFCFIMFVPLKLQPA